MIYEKDGIKIEEEGSLLKRMLYKIFTYKDGKEELVIAGIDFGGRIYIVKKLNEKTFIVKRPNCKILMGARGCGMLWDFGTEYYLARILDEKIPEGWNNWLGYVSFTHKMECGRQWRKGIIELEKIANTK